MIAWELVQDMLRHLECKASSEGLLWGSYALLLGVTRTAKTWTLSLVISADGALALHSVTVVTLAVNRSRS